MVRTHNANRFINPLLLMPMDMMNTPMHSQTVVPENWEVTEATVPILNTKIQNIVANVATQSGNAPEIRQTSRKPWLCG